MSCRSCSLIPSSSWMEPPAQTSAREHWVGPGVPDDFPVGVPHAHSFWLSSTPPSCKPGQALAISAGAGLPRFLGLFCKLRGTLPGEPRVLLGMGMHGPHQEQVSRAGLM